MPVTRRDFGAKRRLLPALFATGLCPITDFFALCEQIASPIASIFPDPCENCAMSTLPLALALV